MDDNKKLNDESTEAADVPVNDSGTVTEYEGMSKGKEAFLKALPLIITLVCVGLFSLGIKLVAEVFFSPSDTLYEINGFQIVHCYQEGSDYKNTYYIYGDDFTFTESEYDNVANEHKNVHFSHVPLVYAMLQSKLDLENTAVKVLQEENGVYVMQFGEFVLYRLEGQYGVFAPLRDYEESATSRKNDLYIIRQLLKNDRYKQFELPDDISVEKFLGMLEKIEWHLDNEYAEDQ